MLTCVSPGMASMHEAQPLARKLRTVWVPAAAHTTHVGGDGRVRPTGAGCVQVCTVRVRGEVWEAPCSLCLCHLLHRRRRAILVWNVVFARLSRLSRLLSRLPSPPHTISRLLVRSGLITIDSCFIALKPRDSVDCIFEGAQDAGSRECRAREPAFSHSITPSNGAPVDGPRACPSVCVTRRAAQLQDRRLSLSHMPSPPPVPASLRHGSRPARSLHVADIVDAARIGGALHCTAGLQTPSSPSSDEKLPYELRYDRSTTVAVCASPKIPRTRR